MLQLTASTGSIAEEESSFVITPIPELFNRWKSWWGHIQTIIPQLHCKLFNTASSSFEIQITAMLHTTSPVFSSYVLTKDTGQLENWWAKNWRVKEGEHFCPSRVSTRFLPPPPPLSPPSPVGGEAPAKPDGCFLNQVHPSPFPFHSQIIQADTLGACVSIGVGQCAGGMLRHTHTGLLSAPCSTVRMFQSHCQGWSGMNIEHPSLCLLVPLLLSLVLPVCFNNQTLANTAPRRWNSVEPSHFLP